MTSYTTDSTHFLWLVGAVYGPLLTTARYFVTDVRLAMTRKSQIANKWSKISCTSSDVFKVRKQAEAERPNPFCKRTWRRWLLHNPEARIILASLKTMSVSANNSGSTNGSCSYTFPSYGLNLFTKYSAALFPPTTNSWATKYSIKSSALASHIDFMYERGGGLTIFSGGGGSQSTQSITAIQSSHSLLCLMLQIVSFSLSLISHFRKSSQTQRLCYSPCHSFQTSKSLNWNFILVLMQKHHIYSSKLRETFLRMSSLRWVVMSTAIS